MPAGTRDGGTDAPDPVIGRTVLGRYRIVRRLARGGMGVVYLARTEGAAGFVRPAVVKRILPDLGGEDHMVRMFVREARILSNLHHPGIVGVLDFGQEGDAYIMVLEYVHGFHLGRWSRYVREVFGRFPAQTAIHVVIKVLEALHHAHALTRPDGKSLNIIHRDVSPSNVLLDTDGRVKLADFGIARVSGETTEFKTEDISLKGKLPYLAPELFHGDPPTPRTDLYACGVLLHELLVGKNEFRGKEMSDTVNRVLQHQPSTLADKRDDVSGTLDEIIAKACAKDPDRRYATAAEFAQALKEVRTLSEDEAQTAIAEQIRRDFTDKMAAHLGTEPLSELDASWRNEPPPPVEPEPDTEPPPGERRKKTSDMPTVAGKTPPGSGSIQDVTPTPLRPPAGREPVAPARGSSQRWVLFGAAAAAALIAAAIGAAVLLPPRAGPPSPVPPVVQVIGPNGTEVTPVALDASDLEQPPAPSAADAGPVVEGPTDGAPVPPHDAAAAAATAVVARPAPPEADTLVKRLTREFRRQSGDIEACFRTHAANVEGTPTLVLRIAVSAEGAVDQASVVTEGLGATPLGHCLVAVASRARFSGLREPVAFRIPVQAQRAP